MEAGVAVEYGTVGASRIGELGLHFLFGLSQIDLV